MYDQRPAGNRGMWALLASVLIVMVGVGITLPVLPLYVERLGAGAQAGRVELHVGLLTAVYPLTQLVFAPIWGRLSDRTGRRPLVLVGILGFAITQLLFGLANGLALLYAARLLGGALSSALLPVASAYIADATAASQRARGMLRFNAAIGVGTLVGPALGGFLSRTDVHVVVATRHVTLDAFSVPFFTAAGLALIALVVALLRATGPTPVVAQALVERGRRVDAGFLVAAATGYVGIMMFEATFALFAVRIGFGASEIGVAFTVCGGAMLAVQLGGGTLVERWGEPRAIATGFVLMSLGLATLVLVTTHPLVFVAVATLGAGMALITPSLASLLSKDQPHAVGHTLGVQQAVQSLGQVGGSLAGVLLFAWHPRAPYVTAALLMASIGVMVAVRRVELSA